MTATVADIVSAYPRGLQWSYAITITGLPGIYSDGLAEWSGLDASRTDHPATLAGRDFKIDLRSDPLKPLTTGGEMSFDLCDDGTGRVFKTFAPSYTGAMAYVTDDVNPGDAVIQVSDGTVFTEDQYAYLGALETVQIFTTAATSVNTIREQLGTVERRHRTLGSGMGNRLTSSPTTFKGRFLTLWGCPVDSTTGLLDLTYASPLWAGQVQTVRQTGGKVQIQCSSLGTVLESEWPAMLPAGRLGSMGAQRYVSARQWTDGLRAEMAWTNFGSGVADISVNIYPFYAYDEGAGPPPYTAADTTPGTYPLSYLIQLIQDTLNYLAAESTEYPWLQASTYRPFQNGITLRLSEERPGKLTLRSTIVPGTQDGIFDTLRVKAFGLDLFLVTGTNRKVADFDKYSGVGAEDTSIPVYLDSPLYPFELSYADTYGAARISDGQKWEIISFTGVSTAGRQATLTGVTRGAGGSTKQAWGYTDETQEVADIEAAPSITQLLFVDSDNALRPEQIILAALLSAEENGTQTAYSFWSGYRQCLGIPVQFVDYDGIRAAFLRSGVDMVQAFWVDEKGKGKTSLEELCKYYGVHFVTRQFVRGGVTYFGLSMESIDPPVATYFQDEVTDADRLAGSDLVVDHNERLVINVASFKPYFKSYGTASPDGVEHFEYDEYSIAEHGAQKAIEFKPTIFDWFTDGSTPGRREQGEAAHIALAINAAYRWFSAFGNGNYTLKMKVPAPAGWRLYPGTHVLLTLTGIRDPNGDEGLVGAAARVVNVLHTIGDRSVTEVEMRITFENRCEFAPCARVTAIASGSFTVSANHYSDASVRSSFNPAATATDAEWFDPTLYGESIPIQVWTEGDYAATVQNLKVTARSGNTLTVDTNLTAATVATNLGGGARTIMSFQAYDPAFSLLQRAFAHIADNGDPPTLGSASHATKEYG